MGSLQKTPLPALLLGLHRDGFTGALTLRLRDESKCFQWQRGVPIGVTSNLRGEDLVSVLVGEGRLAAADMPEIAACMKERGWDALRSVAALQKAAPRDLIAGLVAQINRSLVACFAWQGGEFEMNFEAQSESAPELPVDVLGILHAGIAAHWPLERVLEALGERGTGYPRPGETLAAIRERLPQSPAIDALVQGLDGSQTPFALLQKDPQAPVWAALWVFDVTAALCWDVAEPEAASDEADGSPEIEIVVSGQPTGSAECERAAAEREGDANALDDRAAALRSEVLDLHARLGDITHYELLGLEPGGNAASIKRAYLKAAKRLHPDRLSNLGIEDIKDEANDVFAQITKAHKILSNVEDRGSYDATLEGHTEIDADRVAQAEVFFRKGEALLHAGNFRDAVELLDSAVQVWPEEADYQAAFAWALHRKNPPENQRSLEHFEKAIELGGEQAQTLLRMSFAIKEMGDTPRADALAAKARTLDPAVKA